MTITHFNIRVYGLLIHKGRILLSDEMFLGRPITKFPGGGLEYGEGTKGCLVREVREEMGVEATDLRHFYTTDFFQPSAYRASDQLISIYYSFEVPFPEKLRTVEGASGDGLSGERFRWKDLTLAKVEDVTLPVDRVVMEMLLARHGTGTGDE